jgi:phospholipase C
MTADPGHEFLDVVEQLAGTGATYPPGGPYPAIDMSGFAANYATTTDENTTPPTPDHIGDIMLGFDTASQLPTSYALATSFALCDQWFSSIPGPTWPNRMFVHAASSAGLDHSPSTTQIATWESVSGFTFPHGSLYDALNASGLQWRIYNDNTDAYSDNPQNGSALGAIPQVSALKGVTLLDVNSLTHFASDLQGPYPYQYTFIEPNYGDITADTYVGGSSQHPMDDVYGGEGLIKAVYEAIRNSPLWSTSLLIVTYDEHGGFYDSVAPPAATPPNDGSGSTYNQYDFAFDRLGVRVPAIVVSPLIEAGVVDHTVYDHSSVPATMERLFGFGHGPGRRGERRAAPVHPDLGPHRLPHDAARPGALGRRSSSDPAGRRPAGVQRGQPPGLPRRRAEGGIRDLCHRRAGARDRRRGVCRDPHPR